MKKYRIVKQDGVYYVERRFLFFWVIEIITEPVTGCSFIKDFRTQEDAEGYILNKRKKDASTKVIVKEITLS